MFSKARIPPNSSMEADVPKSFAFQIIRAEKRFTRGAKETCCAHLFYLIPMFFEDMLSAKKNSLGNNVLSRNQDFFFFGGDVFLNVQYLENPIMIILLNSHRPGWVVLWSFCLPMFTCSMSGSATDESKD